MNYWPSLMRPWVTPLQSRVVVIGGTGCPSLVASALYHGLWPDATVWSIPRLGLGKCEDAATTLNARLADRSVLVGHSQGGLLALALAQKNPGLIAAVILLATPVNGTNLASTRSWSGGVRSMSPQSRWLRTLGAVRVPVYSFYTALDGVVVPYSSCHYTGGRNYETSPSPPVTDAAWIPGRAGHTSLLFHGPTTTTVRKVIAESIFEPPERTPQNL